MSEKIPHFANTINKALERIWPAVPLLGIVLGYAFPHAFQRFIPYVPLLFGTITLSGAINLKAREFGKTIRSPLPIAAFLISSHVLMPLLAFLASSFFFPGDNDTIAGFILMFAGPVAVSSFIWVTILRGDKALSLTMVMLDTLLAPLLVPGTLLLLMGARVALNMSGIIISLLLMVVTPTIIGVALNEASKGKIPAVISPYLSPFSKICFLLVIIINTSAIAASIRLYDPMVWKVAAVCVSLLAGNFILSRFAGVVTRCSYEKQVALFFSGSLRNVAAISTIAVTFFSEATVVPSLAFIMFQQLVSAIMGKIMMRKHEKLS